MAEAAIPQPKKRSVRIVLVEDNPGDVFLLEKSLRDRGIDYTLKQYGDGEEAMKALSTDHTPTPDLILLDLNLPRRDGFDVLVAVRQEPRFVDVPVGILTSSDAKRDRHRAALLGTERYIYKPPTLPEFMEQVGSAVEELLALRG
jgi:CheY-like chemotaxis protein